VHRVSWSERELALAQKLEREIAEAGADPPWLRELAKRHALAEGDARRLLRKCVAQGRLYQVVPDLFYGGERVRELAQALQQLARAQPKGVTAAAFRDAIGLGRKRSIQILEFFDRIGYTRRVRDAHVLRADSDWNS
jgi:selenocysteine-specific elongation factor